MGIGRSTALRARPHRLEPMFQVTASRLIALCAGLAACVAAPASPPDPKAMLAGAAPLVVHDLAYGDVLFHFYQGDFLGALVRLDAADHFGRLEHHAAEARLLKGGLYLSLGEHDEAGRIFESLLAAGAAPSVRDRAWFYLAKVWYQREYVDRAAAALASIGDALPAEFEPERRLLTAEVAMSQGRDDEAIAALADWEGTRGWSAYAKFNLGVALVRVHRLDDAARLLDEVGQMEGTSEELAALRDKANLALGYAWLGAGRADDARAVLDRVRLQGPLSNKALLGAGWADSESHRYREALAPWLELKSRSLLDAAVQEAYLAIPFAYAQLAANGQAAEHYTLAIAAYADETHRIDESIAAIRSGAWLESVLAHDRDDQVGWYWQLVALPDAPETRYLYHLMATHRFQEGLKNYRDLELMNRNLAAWSQSLEAFDDMIDARERASVAREPLYERTIENVDLAGLHARAEALRARVDAAERDQDVVALATPGEQEKWQQATALTARLGAIAAADPRAAEMLEKANLARGVLYWQMEGAFRARLWQERRALRELDVALKDASRHTTLVKRARDDMPAATEGFAGRVAAIAPRIDALSTRLAAARTRQAQFLAAIAVEELESQKERLAAYSQQAQFALATLYDRANATADAQGGRE
jgi:hypothetical protein